MENKLPIIDLSHILTKYSTRELWQSFESDTDLRDIVEEFCKAFCTWGFLYIKGHGISEADITQVIVEANNFFNSSIEFKKQFLRGSGISLGYVPINGETFTEQRPYDIKEALDYLPNSNLSEKLYAKIPDFVKIQNDFFYKCSNVVVNLLRILALALGMNVEHFVQLHSSLGNHSENGSTMRLLYYPPVSENVLKDQLRCSEHTDYGTLTMLFQDTVGGLEVLSPSGEFVPVTPIPGTIVINGGDLLQAWSNEKFKATYHKVSIPLTSSLPRQSIAFFTHPNYNTTIMFVDEHGNKQTRNAYEHLKKRFLSTIY